MKKSIFPFCLSMKAVENCLNHLFTCLANQIKFHMAIQRLSKLSMKMSIHLTHAYRTKIHKYSNELYSSFWSKTKKMLKNVENFSIDEIVVNYLFIMHINEWLFILKFSSLFAPCIQRLKYNDKNNSQNDWCFLFFRSNLKSQWRNEPLHIVL